LTAGRGLVTPLLASARGTDSSSLAGSPVAGGGGGLLANVPADFPDLGGEVLFDHVAPHQATFALFVGTALEEIQLFATLPNQGVQPLQLFGQFGSLSLFALHLDEICWDSIALPEGFVIQFVGACAAPHAASGRALERCCGFLDGPPRANDVFLLGVRLADT